MKLQDYFKAQNSYHIDTQNKLLMFEKIISKQNKSQKSFQKVFSIKSFAYWFMSVLILAWIYWIFFLWQDAPYWDFVIQNNTNTVSADYIANIVEFNGTFYVAHENKIYRTNKIANWDSVVLKKWTELVLNINSGTQTKLVWPARFKLSQNESGTYQLTINEWDYIQIESNSWDSMEVVLQDNITIHDSQNLNVLITKTDDEYKINNQWSQIKVTTNNKTKQVEEKQLLAIKDNDIRLIDNVEDFKQAFTKQSISQTFEITDEQRDATDTANALIQEITENKNNNTPIVNNEQISNELWITDSLQIPTQEQTSILYSTLDNSSLMWTLESMYKDRISGNQNDYNSLKNNLNSKIQTLAKTFNLNISKWDISTNISEIKKTIWESYHIPSTQINKLTTLSNWISYIQSQTQWSITDPQKIESSWTNLINNLPSNLKFN